MDEDRQFAQRICEHLNKIIDCDWQVADGLMSAVLSGVCYDPPEELGFIGTDICMLGVLNSILRRTNLGRGLITAVYDGDSGELLRFQVTGEDDV